MTYSNYSLIRTQLDATCLDAGRNPQDVLLVAVSKTVDLDAVEAAVKTGATDFGENRPDELVRKHAAFPKLNWHFIGNIQSRRIPDIVSCATLIHSVCKEEHLAKINAAAEKLAKTQDILLELNISGEASKSGFALQEVEDVYKASLQYLHIQVTGLMTMAPAGDLQEAERDFKKLRHCLEELNAQFSVLQQEYDKPALTELSCGMSGDWRIAVQAGSTIVRIGRAIFDPALCASV